jgi:Cd2+/Zn2+-exporting ATPase
MAEEKVLRIEGMDCADCVLQIERAVNKVKGVRSAKAYLGSSTLAITPETEDLDMNTVVREVKKLGYGVVDEAGAGKATLYVEGMDCADEVEIIDRKMKGLGGVRSYQVNLMNERLDIVYEPSLISPQDIIRAIAETGMKVHLERPKRETKPWWQERRNVLLFVSGLLTLLGFILSWLGLPHRVDWIAFGAAIVIGGYYPAKMGLAGLRSFRLNLYTLLIAAALGAIALSLWHEAALLVFIFSLSSVLESYAVDKARGSLRVLMALVPREALAKRDGKEVVLPVEQVRVGDTIIVRPGEKVPLDGVVVAGASTVDQAPVTGESIPVGKREGDEVFAATINQRGSLEVRVTKLSTDTTLAKVIHSVEEAEAKKSSYQHFAESFGRYYTPAMFGLAFLTALLPMAFGQPFVPWFYRGLVVLVVSCSCGLALSVPVSVVAGITNAARKGILIKGGAYLEAAAGLKAVLFDKTGTLTIGRPQVTDIIALNSPQGELLSVAAAIESRSEHPLADAILRRAKEEGLSVPEVAEFESMTGLGARAKVNSDLCYIGSRHLFERLSVPLTGAEGELSRLENEGKTAIVVGNQRGVLGVIAVADQLRPEAVEAVKGLRKSGIKSVVMLTGDNEGTARAIAECAGADEYKAQLLPEDKVEAVKQFKLKYGKVAMVGDGVNDAPAMATADVGIAMGAAGTDVAMETGDLVLMSDDLSRIPYALQLSRRSVSNIKQNIAAALAIVAFLVPAALAGWIDLVPGLLINEGSMLVVIANGLRLLR